MSIAYNVLYRVGFTPWEEIADLPVVNEQFSALFDREERGRRPPFGPALDLSEEACDVFGAPFYRYMKNADPRIYRLRRD